MLQVLRNIFYDILLERRWRSVELASHGIARLLHPLRDIGREIVGIFRCRHGLVAGEASRGDSPSNQYTAFAEKTAPRCSGEIRVDVGWLGHCASSVRKRRA